MSRLVRVWMLAAVFLTALKSVADSRWWNGVGTGWDSAVNWSTVSDATTPNPASIPNVGDDVIFTITPLTSAQTIRLNGDQSVHSITNSTTGAITLIGGTGDSTLTLGAGGFTRTGSSTTILGSSITGQKVNIVLGADQTWLNTATGSDILISNTVAAAATGDATTTTILTLNAANKGFNFAGNVNTTALIDGVEGRRLALVKNGSGVVTLNSTNTYSGGTTINAGTIVLTAPNASTFGTGPITLAGGTVQHYVGATLSNAITVQAGTTSYFQANSGTPLILTGNLSGSGTLTLNTASGGYGTPQLAGNNSGFSGRFVVNWNGYTRMKFNSPESGSSNAWWHLDGYSADGNSLNFANGTIYLGALSGGGQMRSQSGNTLVVGGLNSNCVYSGNFNGANLVIRKVGTGSFSMTGAANYTGGTQINGGSMIFSNATAFGSGNIAFGGGTLKHGISFTNDVSAKIVNSTGPIAIDDAGQTVTYATALAASNAGGLIKKGSGTLVLSAKPAYTGPTTIESGTLSMSTAFTSVSSMTVTSDAIVNVNGSLSCGNITLGSRARLSTVGAITGGVITVDSGALISIAKSTAWPLVGTFEIMTYTAEGSSTLSDANVSVSGISGNSVATLDFSTAGKVYLNIASEKLVWDGSDGADWRSANAWRGQNTGSSYTFTDNDAVIITNGTSAGTSTIAIALSDVTPSSVLVDLGTGYSRTLTGAYGIAGAQTTLTKTGAGSIVVATANSYGGATTVTAGEFILGNGSANGSLGASSPIAVAAHAAFVVNSAAATTQTVANTISGAGVLKKRGTGALTLSGQTRFTEQILVEEGTLRLNPSSDFTLSAIVTNAGTIEHVAKTITLTNAAQMVGVGSQWILQSGAAVKLAGDYGGGLGYFNGYAEVRLSGAKISLNDYLPNATLAMPLHIAEGTSNIVDGSEANFWINGSLVGSGIVNSYSAKRGIILSGDNSAFSGTYNFQTGGGQYCSQGFWNTNAGSSNAIWNINYNTVTDRGGAIHSLRFDSGGTYRFGALNTIAGSVLYCRQGMDGIPSVYNTVLEIGHLNRDCAIEGKFVKNRLTLNKVGTAKLTLGSGFECPAGTVFGVYGGVLCVNAQLTNASISAGSGTQIEGVGAWTNAFAWNSGVTLSPGTNGVGSLTVLSTPIVASGSVFSVNVQSNGMCTALIVKGDVDVTSTTLQVADVNRLNEAYSYTILSTDGGMITGKFADNNLPSGWVVRREGSTLQLVKVPLGTVLMVL